VPAHQRGQPIDRAAVRLFLQVPLKGKREGTEGVKGEMDSRITSKRGKGDQKTKEKMKDRGTLSIWRGVREGRRVLLAFIFSLLLDVSL